MPSAWEAVLLGSLLHDIGKLWLRTGEDLWRKVQAYCTKEPKHTNFAECRECRDKFQYAHALLSSVFIGDRVPSPSGKRPLRPSATTRP